MKKLKNKKIVLSLVLLLVVGVSFAYYTTTDSFENIFKTLKYGTQVEEVFESPDNWKPGDETEKKVIAKNTGNVCENVRVSYTEKWESENGTNLPLVDPTSNEKVAIINFDNQEDWKENGNYYYYNKNLLAGESTTSFIKSVTYNGNYSGNLNCTNTTEGNKTTKECTSGADSYEGATYTLTIKVETIQCDGMEDEWGITIEELKPKYRILSGDLDTVGSEVCIQEECFYVIGKEDNKVKMLAKWNLKVGNIVGGISVVGIYNNYNAGYGLQDENMKGAQIDPITKAEYTHKYGTVKFSNTNYWVKDDILKSEYGDSYPAYVYDSNSELKQYVDEYVAYLNNQGVSVTGRLITKEEIETLVNNGNALSNGYLTSTASDITGKEWIYQTGYWSGSANNTNSVWCVNSIGNFGSGTFSYALGLGVRPVIILEP